MKVIAVIPCFCEQMSIADLVFKSNQLIGMTFVADDHSTDGTAEEAEGAGAYVVRHWGKRGFGSNSMRGIEAALIRECDIVVTMDGDGQHDPQQMMRVIEPIEKGEADVVVGSRFLEKNCLVPFYRKVGIKIITWLYNVGKRDRISDAQCCFRAYRSDILRQLMIEEMGFTFSTETLIKARALGARIKEVPVSVLYHKQFSRNSTLNPVVQGVCVALGTLKVRLKVELFGKLGD